MAVRALQEDGRLIYIIARKKRVVYIYYRVVLSISYFDYSSLYHYSDKLSLCLIKFVQKHNGKFRYKMRVKNPRQCISFTVH